MKKAKIELKTLEYFQSGYNCAEALSKAVTEEFLNSPYNAIPRVASGFGGGVGASKGETCGALAGGIIALGCLVGRNDPQEDKTTIYKLAAKFRQQFIETFSSGNCQSILNNLGQQENMQKCKQMTSQSAGILCEILEEFRGST